MSFLTLIMMSKQSCLNVLIFKNDYLESLYLIINLIKSKIHLVVFLMIRMYTYVWMYIHVFMYTYVYTYVCMHVCMNECMCMYVCMYECMHDVCMYVNASHARNTGSTRASETQTGWGCRL